MRNLGRLFVKQDPKTFRWYLCDKGEVYAKIGQTFRDYSKLKNSNKSVSATKPLQYPPTKMIRNNNSACDDKTFGEIGRDNVSRQNTEILPRPNLNSSTRQGNQYHPYYHNHPNYHNHPYYHNPNSQWTQNHPESI